jgi:hypothetical protein
MHKINLKIYSLWHVSGPTEHGNEPLITKQEFIHHLIFWARATFKELFYLKFVGLTLFYTVKKIIDLAWSKRDSEQPVQVNIQSELRRHSWEVHTLCNN